VYRLCFPFDIALHSRLPSGGITHFQRYYAAIRLAAFRLPSFLYRIVWHTFYTLVPFWGDEGNAVSPQLIQCHCMTWLTSDPAMSATFLPDTNAAILDSIVSSMSPH